MDTLSAAALLLGICWGPWGILEDFFNQNGWLMNAVHSHCRLRLASLDVLAATLG
jgi:hypothetical protein